MPADEFEPETPPRSSSKAPSIAALCVELCRLDTGPLAELRRMEPDGPGTADFWKLALCHNLPTRRKADTTRAIQFVRILALLTPKGEPPDGKKLFDKDKSFGMLLAAKTDRKSAVSEMRLLNFIALSFDRRGAQLERFARRLAARGHRGVNAWDIWNLIAHDDVKHTRKLAHDYFGQASRDEKQAETGKDVA